MGEISVCKEAVCLAPDRFQREEQNDMKAEGQFNNEYRSSVFAGLFSDKERLLELSNAVNGTDYTSAEGIEINTLNDENGIPSGIFLKIKNDISFVFGSYLDFYEHQSTVCGNMPLRMLFYISELFQRMYERKLFYRKKPVELPVPRFYVFYNGSEEIPDRMEYKLSDQYKIKVEDLALELKVTVLNINAGRNRELMEKSGQLREYSEFVYRTYTALNGKKTTVEKQEAMRHVIDECIKDGILTEFLMENGRWVMMSSILEYDEQAHMEAVHEDGYDEGYDKGRAEEQKVTEKERARAEAAEQELRELRKKLQELNVRLDS